MFEVLVNVLEVILLHPDVMGFEYISDEASEIYFEQVKTKVKDFDNFLNKEESWFDGINE